MSAHPLAHSVGCMAHLFKPCSSLAPTSRAGSVSTLMPSMHLSFLTCHLQLNYILKQTFNKEGKSGMLTGLGPLPMPVYPKPRQQQKGWGGGWRGYDSALDFGAQGEAAQERLLATVSKTRPTGHSPSGGCPFTGFCDTRSSIDLTLTSAFRHAHPEAGGASRNVVQDVLGVGLQDAPILSSQGTHSEE